jgi:DNA topoisomerase-1
MASSGHIDNLPKKELGIDIENQFKPNYVILSDKKKIAIELKNEIQKCQTVWLATDKDYEGERIAKAICDYCKPKKYYRVYFTEITPKAIKESFENPYEYLNQKYLDCQETRRITDRLIGYKLSPILWKSLKIQQKQPLSIGRVQAATLSILMEQQEKINKFVSEKKWDITGRFNILNDQDLKLHSEKSFYKNDILHLFKNLKNEWKYNCKPSEIVKTYPSKPFITSTLQQAAYQELRFPIRKTMSVAQKLYEKGFITYMRTDSAILSDDFIHMASDFISNKYGNEFLNSDIKPIKNKKNAQEAHEAIRPTSMNTEINLDIHHQKLYKLIWNRAVGHLMKPAVFEDAKIHIKDSSFENDYFIGNYKKLVFLGFLILKDKSDNDYQNSIKELDKIKMVRCCNVTAKEKMTEGPKHFDESSLVKALETDGIGRPATYQISIDKLVDKHYIVNKNIEAKKENFELLKYNPNSKTLESKLLELKFGKEKDKFIITETGQMVYEFLSKYFPFIINKNYTKEMEDNIDKIIIGESNKLDILTYFYNTFEPLLHQHFDVVKTNSILRVFKYDKKTIKILNGPFGFYIQFSKNKKNINISLTPYMELFQKSLDDLNVEDVSFLMSFPKMIKGKKIEYGRYGFYCRDDKSLQCNQLEFFK